MTMVATQAVKTITLSGIVVESRASDHFINATQLCKAGGKKFAQWMLLESTRELVATLKAELSSNVEILTFQKPLIETTKGRYGGGSWIHPDLAVQLAQWISPAFALQVSRWIRELFATGSVQVDSRKTDEELKRLSEETQNLRYQLQEKNCLIEEKNCLIEEHKGQLAEKNSLLKEKTALLEEHKGQLERLHKYNKDLLSFKKLKERNESIYIVSSYNYVRNGLFKIGRTKDMKRRTVSHNTTHVNGDRIEVLAEFKVNNSKLVEDTIHKKLEGLRPSPTSEFYMCPYDLLVDVVDMIVHNDHEMNERVNRLIDTISRLQVSTFDPEDWCKGLDMRKKFPYVFPEEIHLLDAKENETLASFDVSRASVSDKKAFVQDCIHAYRRNILKVSDQDLVQIAWPLLHPFIAEIFRSTQQTGEFRQKDWYKIAKEAAADDGRSVVLYRRS